MAFKLNEVVPWGRNLDEYVSMFSLTQKELDSKIAGFGDGPASFNCELTRKGGNIISFDPIYQFSRGQIEKRILETKDIVMKQTEENQDNYIWTNIKTLEELELKRMDAMKSFLDDFEEGREEGRYICHELPKTIKYEDDYFDLGLSSHFLLLYKELGEEFHISAISEMLRVCKEVRIFPVVDLNGNESSLTDKIIKYYSNYSSNEKKKYDVKLVNVPYQFQKNGDMMLKIRKTN